MKKDLFGDLFGEQNDFSSKYDKQNIEFNKQQKIKEIDEFITLLSSEEKNLNWAKLVLSTYEENKKNIKELKYNQLFENLKQEAVNLLKEHEEKIKQEEREKQRLELLKKQEQERAILLKQEMAEMKKLAEENNNIKTAQEIDQNINMLKSGIRNMDWADSVDKLYEKVSSLKFEQRKHCKNLLNLEDLKSETKFVYKASVIDNKILHLKAEVNRDKDWCNQVLKLNNNNFKNLLNYIQNIDIYNNLVKEIQDAELELQRQEQEKIRQEQEKIRQEQEQKQKEIELEAKKLKLELELKIEEENRIKNLQRQNLIQNFLMLSSDSSHPFVYKIQDDKIVLDYTDKKDIKNFIIPVGVEIINDNAFAYQRKLKEVVIPSTVEFIKEKAFYECDSLKSLNIPDSVKQLGEYVFANCVNLKDIYVSNQVKEIPKHCFEDCAKLQKCVANNVEDIKENAFLNCKNLTNLEVKNLKNFDKSAFKGCIKLSNVKSNYNESIFMSIPHNVQFKKIINRMIKNIPKK